MITRLRRESLRVSQVPAQAWAELCRLEQDVTRRFGSLSPHSRQTLQSLSSAPPRAHDTHRAHGSRWEEQKPAGHRSVEEDSDDADASNILFGYRYGHGRTNYSGRHADTPPRVSPSHKYSSRGRRRGSLENSQSSVRAGREGDSVEDSTSVIRWPLNSLRSASRASSRHTKSAAQSTQRRQRKTWERRP